MTNSDAFLAYFFQTFGMALIACALCWVALPKAGMSGAAQRLLFAKLVGVCLAIHFVALAVVLGGANVVITALATYAVGRWVLLRKRIAE